MTVKKKKAIADSSEGMKKILANVVESIDMLDSDVKKSSKMDRLTLFSRIINLYVAIGNYMRLTSEVIANSEWAEAHTQEELVEYFKALAAICLSTMIVYKTVIPEHKLGNKMLHQLVENVKEEEKMDDGSEGTVPKQALRYS